MHTLKQKCIKVTQQEIQELSDPSPFSDFCLYTLISDTTAYRKFMWIQNKSNTTRSNNQRYKTILQSSTKHPVSYCTQTHAEHVP